MSLSCASKSAFKSLISGTGEKSTLIMSVGVSVHTNYESVCLGTLLMRVGGCHCVQFTVKRIKL